MKPSRFDTTAFSLVEVTMALGIAAFAMVGIFQLLPIGLISNLASTQQTAATNIDLAIISDLRQVPTVNSIAANPTLKSTSPRFGIDVASTYSSASPKTIYFDEAGMPLPSSAGARSRATIILNQPATGLRTATIGNILISWPAAVDPMVASPMGSMSTFVALNRN